MISLAIDLVLLVALVVTSGCVLLVHWRLRKLDACHAEYRRTLIEMGHTLDTGRNALASLRDDGRAVAIALAGKIDQARGVLREIERREEKLHSQAAVTAPTVVPFVPARTERGY